MNKAKHAVRSLLSRWVAAVQGGASSAEVLPPNPRWAQEHWMEELGVSAFKDLRLEPHSAPKSLSCGFLCPKNLLVCFLELETCFSNSVFWGTHGILSLWTSPLQTLLLYWKTEGRREDLNSALASHSSGSCPCSWQGSWWPLISLPA